MTERFDKIKKKLGYLFLLVLMIAIDQLTKRGAASVFLEWFDPNDTRSYRSGTKHVFSFGQATAEAVGSTSSQWLDFHITYVRNHGAAWGMFSNAPDLFRLWGFYLLTLLVSGYIIYLFRKTTPQEILQRCGYVCILAGAAGNFIDRAVLKYVIDWIHFSWNIFGWEYNFPVFNWADVSINIGIILILMDSFVSKKQNTN